MSFDPPTTPTFASAGAPTHASRRLPQTPGKSIAELRSVRLPPHGLSAESDVEFRHVLRRRLLVLSVLYDFLLVYLFVLPSLLGIELGHHHIFSTSGLTIGTVMTLLTAGLSVWLLQRRLFLLRVLRTVELVLHGGAILFCASWQYDELVRLQAHPLWGHEYEDVLVRSSAYANSIHSSILIVLYGLLIPNTWRRCTAVCLVTAAIPLLIHWIATPPGRGEIVVKLVAGSTAAFAVAMGLAIFGSHKISTLQQEVKIVRQQARALGQYQLKRRLGGGGMGEVYLAEHSLLKRPCAVKFIHPEMTAHPSYIARFEREVQALARLAHPNVVEIYDYGRSEEGVFYYAMEYLPGLDLHQLVAQMGPLAPGRAVYFLRQISAALHEAHALGLIHRDVKPSNILVTQRGSRADFVKLLDFGLVRGHEDQQGQLTQLGLILGTPGYMSPEQAAGETKLDARSDIYSIGAVGYFLLSGQAPFAGKPAGKIIAAHVLESPPPLQELRRDVPDDLSGVVARCLAREAAERFADAGQLEQAFAACACAADWSKEKAVNWWQTLQTAEIPAPSPSQA